MSQTRPNTETLYILGNGFDRAHGFATSYSDFHSFLFSRRRLDLIIALESIFPACNSDGFLLWSEFENALGRYDDHKVSNWGLNNLHVVVCNDGASEEYIPKDIADSSIFNLVRNPFAEWVNSIKITGNPKYSISKQSQFLTFNYTETLEKLYGIPDDHILHIHGKAHFGSELIIGHRTDIPVLDSIKGEGDFRTNNINIQNHIDIQNLYKQCETIIDDNSQFFSDLHSINSVIVFGHSYDEIDWPYFEKIKACICDTAQWTFYCYDEKDNAKYQKLRCYLNIEHFSPRASNQFPTLVQFKGRTSQ